jgi:hypothetical protein
MRKIIFISTLVTFLTIPAVALAGHGHHGDVNCTNAAACQYVESVPGGGGPQSTSGGGPGGGGQALSPSTQRALEDRGSTGAATAALANATSQRSFANGGGSHGSTGKGSDEQGSGDAASTAGETGGGPKIGSALSHVLGADSSGSGMGLLLPIILGLTLVGAIALAIGRRRGAHPA